MVTSRLGITPRPLRARPVKNVVLLSDNAEFREKLYASLASDAIMLHMLNNTTEIPKSTIISADVILLDISAGEKGAFTIARILADSTMPAMVFILGDEKISDGLLGILIGWRRMSLPIDMSYLRGIVDSAHFDKSHVRSIDEEHARMRRLYELSSALLKVTHRSQLPPLLEEHLPSILDASVFLLSSPTLPNPLVFLHSSRELDSASLVAMRDHLADAWVSLRPDVPSNWRWVEAIPISNVGFAEGSLDKDAFISAPINYGSVVEGFLTMLPRRSITEHEGQLQTFFIIADMLSVLMDNLQLKEKLEERATHDGLTGLLNRPSLFDLFEKEFRRARRYQHPLSIMVIDIDHFKSVNDSYGHGGGDEALRVFAEELRSCVRENDLLGRIGGEEFLIVLPNTPMEGAIIWAERFRENLESQVVEFEGHVMRLTASLGVAELCAHDNTVDELVARADKALYEAKRGGRNRVVKALTSQSSEHTTPEPR